MVPQEQARHGKNVPRGNQNLGGVPKPDPPSLQDHLDRDLFLPLPPPVPALSVPTPAVQQQPDTQGADVTDNGQPVTHGSPSTPESAPSTSLQDEDPGHNTLLHGQHTNPSTSGTALQPLSLFSNLGTSSGSGPDITSPDRQNQLHTVSTQLYPPLCNTRTADTAAPGKGKTKANKGNKASNKTSAEVEQYFGI